MMSNLEDVFVIKDGKKSWNRNRVNGYSDEAIAGGLPRDNEKVVEGCSEILTRKEIERLFPNQYFFIKITEYDTFPRYWSKAQVLYFHCTPEFCFKKEEEMCYSKEYATWSTFARDRISEEQLKQDLAKSKKLEERAVTRSTADMFVYKDGKKCWKRDKVYGYSDRVMCESVPDDNEDTIAGCSELLTEEEINKLFPNQSVFIRMVEYSCDPGQWSKAEVLYFHCSSEFADMRLVDLNYPSTYMKYNTHTFNATEHYLNW